MTYTRLVTALCLAVLGSSGTDAFASGTRRQLRTPVYPCYYDKYNHFGWYPSYSTLGTVYYPTQEACTTAQQTAPQQDPKVLSLANDSPLHMTVAGGTTYRSTACAGVVNCTGIQYYNWPKGNYTDALSPPVGSIIAPGERVAFCLFSTLTLELHNGDAPAGIAKIAFTHPYPDKSLSTPADLNKLLKLKWVPISLTQLRCHMAPQRGGQSSVLASGQVRWTGFFRSD